MTFLPHNDPPEESSRHPRAQAAAIVLLALEGRVRATDVVGRVAPDGVGVVLPETTAEGAAVFARAIVSEAYACGLDVAYKIYDYPLHPTEGLPQRIDAEPHLTPAVGLEATASVAELLPDFKLPTWKRALDLFGAVVGILCFIPLLAVLGVWIKLVSPARCSSDRSGSAFRDDASACGSSGPCTCMPITVCTRSIFWR